VRPPLAVVVPALDAAPALERLLPTFGGLSVVVADGGSRDNTREVALAHGATLVDAPRGRGTQLRAGAEAAPRGAGWLLFLHADTLPGPGWFEAVAAATRGDPDLAHHFRFALDDDSPQARRLERAVAWRCRRLGLPYGDQGLLISRALHDRLGGFAPVPLMEDVDFVARIGRARLRELPACAVTSAERWRREGWNRRSARNLLVLGLWLAGVSPSALARLYARP